MVRKRQLVLSLFPVGGLLDKAFQDAGFVVVRGPDVLWGDDIENFSVDPGMFDGVIGGPPCQPFSSAKGTNTTKAVDRILDFLRIVREAAPGWAVMENVIPVLSKGAGPDWPVVKLRDWDCGGLTHRRRAFWFYGVEPPPLPEKLPITDDNKPEYSPVATAWKERDSSGSASVRAISKMTGKEAARRQGMLDKYAVLKANKPSQYSSVQRQIGYHG